MASNLPPQEAEMRSAQLLREAEEALAEERLRDFWTTHGKTVLAMAVMLVLGTAAGTGWRTWRAHVNAQSTDILLTATSPAVTGAPDTNALQAQLTNLTGEQRTLGTLVTAAQLANASGEDADLRAKLAKLFGTDTAPQKDAWKWLQAWGALRLQMNDAKGDSKALQGKFVALATAQGKSALGALAYIDAALLAGERDNDPAAALNYLGQASKLIETKNGTVYGLIEELTHLYTTAQTAKKK